MNRSPKTFLPGRDPQLSKGYAALFATVVIWSVPSLFQYYLIPYYEPWSQNFYRYSVACLAIAPFVYQRIRRGGPKIDSHAISICLPPCIPNVIHQVGQVIALYYIGPGVYAIFGRTSVIFAALLALIFFPEERSVIRQWKFQAGTAIGLIGAFGVIWFQRNGADQHIAWPGLAIAVTATFCWALYSVMVKRPSAELGPIRSFGIISFFTSCALLFLTLVFGKIAAPLHAGTHVNLILIVSAVVCITLAHILYYIAIHQIGVALSQTLQLLCPVGALLLSAWIFHERLTIQQLFSAIILLLGTFLAMQVKPAETVETAENL